MPADVSFQHVATQTAPAADTARMPLGIGLAFAACASVGLWIGVAAGIKALFF